MTVKKKEEPVVEPEESTDEGVDITAFPFSERYYQLGKYVREKAPEVLKFDSNVDNIDYDYVDTQQYKTFIGMCADACGISFAWGSHYPDLQIATNDKGKQIFIVTILCTAIFMDRYSDEKIEIECGGMGTSFGNNYACSIAQTNAIRNFLTNNFLIPTNDRDTDDMKQSVNKSWLTDSEKSEKREALLEKTKTVSEYATVSFGNVVASRIAETLKLETIPTDFRTTLENFRASKFTEKDGVYVPNTLEGSDTLWIVKKKAANKILSDLDEYND